MPRPSPRADFPDTKRTYPGSSHSRSTSGVNSGAVNISCFNFNTQVLVREIIISDSLNAPLAHLRCKSGEAAVFTPHSKEPFEFCFDPESLLPTPDALLPKFSHTTGLEVQFIMDASTMDVSGNAEGDDWFLLHASSETEVSRAIQDLSKDTSHHLKLNNLVPVRPEACSRNPTSHISTQDKDTLAWNWRWTSLVASNSFSGGFKNICAFVKRAGTEFHVISQFKFWTPLTISGRKVSSSSLHALSHKTNWFTSSHPPPCPLADDSQLESELSVSELLGKTRPRQGSFDSDAGEMISAVEFEEDDSASFFTAQGHSSVSEVVFPQSALADISFGSDYVFRDDDGPVFRATLQHLEKRVHSFRLDIKRLLKLGLEAMESRKESLRHERALMDALLGFPSIQPLAAAYLNQATLHLRQSEDAQMQSIPNLILNPLRLLYDTEIKVAESKKKQFHQDSDDYYSYLSKYLAAKKDQGRKGTFSDAKYQERRRHFELSRFNYFIYIHELRGGVKDHQILSSLTKYAEKQLGGLSELHDSLLLLKPGLDQIQLRVSEAEKELSLQRKDLDEKRRQINKTEDEFAERMFDQSSNGTSGAGTPAVLRNKFHGIRDLQPTNHATSLAAGRKREGFLFTSSRTTAKFDKTLPGQGSWHKKWCVLSGGCLHEYNNWKKLLEVNCEPLPLQFATARMAVQTSRKFCFEVVTPKLRRQYQATSEEDMENWITCISNAIQSLWSGTSSCDDLRALAHPQHQSTASPLGPLADQQYLLKLLHEDDSNRTCADCDAAGPEWCSINFGVLLCIECSGIHRSLGTHITKVRSLDLDVVTFTPDLVALLQRLGNHTANAFWEACLDENNLFVDDHSGFKWTKPTSADDRSFKSRFITAKYVEHKFLLADIPAPSLEPHLVQGLDDNLLVSSTPTAAIFAGVLQDQPMAALQSILLGGDVDGLLQVLQPSPLVKTFGHLSLITPLHIALFCIDQNDPEARVPYTMAELLIQNGANVNVMVEGTAPTLLHFAALHNDLAAIQYLLLKGALPTIPHENPDAWPCFLATEFACQQLLRELTFTEAQKMNFDPSLLKLIAPPLPPRNKHPDDDDDHSPVSSPVSPDNESMNSAASLIPAAVDEPGVPDRPADLGRSISADSRNLASPIKRLSGGWRQQLQQLAAKDSSRDQSHSSSFSSSFTIPKRHTFRRSTQVSTPHDFSRSEDSTPGGTVRSRSRPPIGDQEHTRSRHRHSPSQPSLRPFSPAPASSASSSPSPPRALIEPSMADYSTPSSSSYASTPSRLPSRTPFAVTDTDASHSGAFLSKRLSKPNRAASIMEAFRKMSK